MSTEAKPLKRRGLASDGALFKQRSGDGKITDSFYSRVLINGKRHYLNCGPDPDRAGELNRAARELLQKKVPVSEVKKMLEVARRHNHLTFVPVDGRTFAVVPPALNGDAMASLHAIVGRRIDDVAAAASRRQETATGKSDVPPQTEETQPSRLSDGPGPKASDHKNWKPNYALLLDFRELCDPANQPAKCPTLREFIAVLLAAKNLGIRSTTLHRYIFSLLNILETVLYARAGRSDEKPNRSGQRVALDDFVFLDGIIEKPLLDYELSVFDHRLLEEYKMARIRRFAETSGGKRKSRDQISAENSADTEIRQARALFSKKKISSECDSAWLRLPPAIFHFRFGVSLFKNAPRPAFVPSPDQVRALHAEIRRLAGAGDRTLVAILVLALFCGLRRGEVLHARRRRLTKSIYGPLLEVAEEEDFIPKFRKSRSIVIRQWLLDWLGASSDNEYIVSDEPKDRTRGLRRAYDLLRSLGYDVDKPLHALRALYGAYLLRTGKTRNDVTNPMGHKFLVTMFRHYAEHPIAKEFVRLWHTPLPLAGPRPKQLVMPFSR